jgi:RHS repeat-associated protein
VIRADRDERVDPSNTPYIFFFMPASGSWTIQQYLLQNWRGDVIGSTFTGTPVLGIRYSAYGVVLPTDISSADFDGNGNKTVDDIFIFLNAWFTGCTGVGVPSSTCARSADIDSSGSLTVDDIFIFLNQWFSSAAAAYAQLPSSFRKGYAGYENDPIVPELYHVRNRIYDTKLARWMSRDPIGYHDGMDLYEYIKSNPLKATDPSGMCTKIMTATEEINIDNGCGNWRPDGPASGAFVTWPPQYRSLIQIPERWQIDIGVIGPSPTSDYIESGGCEYDEADLLQFSINEGWVDYDTDYHKSGRDQNGKIIRPMVGIRCRMLLKVTQPCKQDCSKTHIQWDYGYYGNDCECPGRAWATFRRDVYQYINRKSVTVYIPLYGKFVATAPSLGIFNAGGLKCDAEDVAPGVIARAGVLCYRSPKPASQNPKCSQ